MYPLIPPEMMSSAAQLVIYFVTIVAALISFMMTSRLPLPNLKGRNIVTVMLLVGILNYTAVVIRPSWLTIIWWNVWNALIFCTAQAQDRRLDLDSGPEVQSP